MNCESIREGLDDFVDGVSSPDLEAHLEGCPGCREEEGRLRALKARLAGLPDEMVAPADLWQQVEAAVAAVEVARDTVSAPFRQRARAAVTSGRNLRWAAAAAVVLISVSTFDFGGPAGPTPTRSAGNPLATREAAALEWLCAGAQTILTSEMSPGPVSPTVAVVLAEVSRIDTAIAEIRRELESPDSSGRGVEQMAKLCGVKLRLLHKAAKLSKTYNT